MIDYQILRHLVAGVQSTSESLNALYLTQTENINKLVKSVSFVRWGFSGREQVFVSKSTFRPESRRSNAGIN